MDRKSLREPFAFPLHPLWDDDCGVGENPDIFFLLLFSLPCAESEAALSGEPDQGGNGVCKKTVSSNSFILSHFTFTSVIQLTSV